MLHRATTTTTITAAAARAAGPRSGSVRQRRRQKHAGIGQSVIRGMHFAAGLNYARAKQAIQDAARPQAKSNFAYLSSGIILADHRNYSWLVN